jgi:hypothetical protein
MALNLRQLSCFCEDAYMDVGVRAKHDSREEVGLSRMQEPRKPEPSLRRGGSATRM